MNDDGRMFEDIERRALEEMADEDDDVAPDLVGSITGDAPVAEPSTDVTLGGYIELHSRVPAFDGADGQPYTVDVDTEPDDDDDGFVSFLVFIRWAATGAGIMDHVESRDVGRGDTADLARQAALDLSLYEVKAELDAAIERRRIALEE
ncbi:MAG TPA: hypothetical protein VK928_10120 [Longimicrobiales bacterium]|nr:hypothetical protein [Longimicrobiales bacterium]